MWKKRKNTVESSESNRTADNDCTRPEVIYCLKKRPLASNTKATSIYLEGVQKPHRSEALGVTKGPVYHGKDFRLHSSSSPREGNTCSFLEQDVILPSNCRFWSGMNSLWCCLRVPLPCSGGNVEAGSYLYHLGPDYPPLNITFMGFFHRSLSGQDRTGQDRAVPSEYPSQQACSSAEPELLKRWTNELLSLTAAACSVAGLALLSRDKTAWGPQAENLSLTASLWMSGMFSVMWLCEDHTVSLQTPKTKIRERTGDQEENWEDTFYTLLWVLQ